MFASTVTLKMDYSGTTTVCFKIDKLENKTLEILSDIKSPIG